MEKVIIWLPDQANFSLEELSFLYRFHYPKGTDTEIEFKQGVHVYSKLTFKGGELVEIPKAPPINKYNRTLGQVITDDLSLITKKYITDALKGFFCLPVNDRGDSFFIAKHDLVYDLVKITDLKAKAYTSDPTVKSSMKLVWPQNLKTRASDYHFQSFKVKYQAVKKALEELGEIYYIHIHLWYFPEKRLGLSSPWVKEYLKYREWKTSGNSKKYHRARRLREKALNELANILIRG